PSEVRISSTLSSHSAVTLVLPAASCGVELVAVFTRRLRISPGNLFLAGPCKLVVTMATGAGFTCAIGASGIGFGRLPHQPTIAPKMTTPAITPAMVRILDTLLIFIDLERLNCL